MRICTRVGLSKKIAVFILVVFCSSFLFSLDNPQENYCVEKLWQDFKKLPQEQRPHIALVLGGGGARGFAHVGVLKVFEEEGIPIDSIVGTSVGAFVGALYASGISIDQIEHIAQTIKWSDMANTSPTSIFNLLFFNHLLKTERMQQYLEKYIQTKRFDELKIPFSCVATDIQTGERIILREGLVSLAVRASTCVPGLFTPVEYKQRFLVDGGIVDNLPIDIAKMNGADIIIAVNIESDFTKAELDNIYQTILQISAIQKSILNKQLIADADVVLEPKVGEVDILELQKGRDSLYSGMTETRQKLLDIKKAIVLKSLAMMVQSKRKS